MALVTGEELATALDLDYDPPEEPYDQVAAAADDIVASLLTDAAYELEPPACKEAALAVAVEIFQARTAAGGQAVATDFSPGPYRLSVWMTRRVMSLLGPYMDVKGMIG
jgi:hypothetical protein